MSGGAAQIDVGGLLDTLGASLIRAATGSCGLDRAVSVPVMYDGRDELPDTPGGVLFMVGSSPADPAVPDVLVTAVDRGFAAVVVKPRDEPVEPLAAVATDAGIALLVVNAEVPWRHLDTLVTAASSGRTPGYGRPGEGGDLFVLANAVAGALGGATAIEDLDRRVLAYSTIEGHRVDPLRRNGILARQVPEVARNADQYRELMLTDGVVHFPYYSSDGELARCATAVRAGRRMVGSIWVIEQDRPIGPEGESVLLESSRLAAIQILRLQSDVDLERQVRSEWLRSMLEGQRPVAVTASRFGVTPGTASVLAGFMLRHTRSRGEPLVRQMTSAVEDYCGVYRSNVSCVEVGRIVYVLFPVVRDVADPRRVVEGAVRPVESRLGCVVAAALSSSASGTEMVPQLRREVDEVLDALTEDESAPAVASAADVHAALVLRRLSRDGLFQGAGQQDARGPGAAGSDVLRSAGVQALLEHDAGKGSGYRETLCAYFAAMGDVGAAAAALEVHPNTLRYRLRRAEQLFGLRLDHADEALVTWLELRLSSL